MPSLKIKLPLIKASAEGSTVNIQYNPPMGLSGYLNLGNTCFLNSCIQVLNHTYELIALHSALTQKHCDETNLWNEYDKLRTATLVSNKLINPLPFVRMVHELAMKKGKILFTGWAQNDLPEFLLFMIDAMHTSICRKTSTHVLTVNPSTNNSSKDNLAKLCLETLGELYSAEYSEIMELFYGLYVSKIASIETLSSHSFKPEPFFILDLPIPPNTQPPIHLLDCLNEFIKIEHLDGDNKWMNEDTQNKESATKQILFWSLPPILVICLKRFTATGEKIHSFVDFPIENLNLSSYVVGYTPEIYNYDLFGVCNHIGTTMGGHYTSFVKNMISGENADDSQWISYDDSHASLIPTPKSIITPLAYCLFYRRKNMIA